MRSLTSHHKPGMMLERPSLAEAGMDEMPQRVSRRTPLPLVEVSSSSSTGSDANAKVEPSKKAAKGNRGRRGKSFAIGGGMMLKRTIRKGSKKDGQDHQTNPDFIHMGPDGKPLKKTVLENLQQVFTDCVFQTFGKWRDLQNFEEKDLEYENAIFIVDCSLNESCQETSICEISSITNYLEKSVRGSSICEISGITSFEDDEDNADPVAPTCSPTPRTDGCVVWVHFR